MKVLLPPSLLGQIEAEACRAFPRECCGLVEGVWQGGQAHVLALHPAPDGEVDRFAIDPGVHFAALKMARAKGHRLIGCYHSHPGSEAVPSKRDREGAGEGNFLWLIAALKDAETRPVLRAWRYSGVDFVETGWVTGADFVTSSSKTR
jgi:proteasome lid subunit RPN8/RPN11